MVTNGIINNDIVTNIIRSEMVKIDNVHLRMREMFKPSMAELGLCMYQVANIQTHPIILTFKRPNMCTPLYQVANIQTSKKLHPKLNHGQSWGFKKELLEILYTFSLSPSAGHPGPRAHPRPLCSFPISSKFLG